MAEAAAPVAVEPATARDLPALAALVREADVPGWSEDALRAALADPLSIARVARRCDGAAPGFALAQRAADEVELLLVAVAPAMRRAGIGRSLVAAALRDAARAGARTAHLEVRASNAAAIALYRALGFVAVGRRARYYAGGEEAVRMSRSIGREAA